MVPTRQMRDELDALGFHRLVVVGRGIDTALFNPGKRSRELRALWGCKGEETVALYVGRLAAEKNLGLFVESVKAMRAVDPGIRVVLVGDGPEGPELRRANPDFVFAGMRTGEDLAAHYASADVFIFPSITETFGNVTLEAMASGLAIVAYDYAAAANYLVTGESGLLARFDSREAFNLASAQMARDRGLRARMRAKARSIAEALSWEHVFDDLEAVLFDAIAANPAGPRVQARGKSANVAV
jgi:glycosyltransferase involved in cell wall biosynthesis